ncbi:MAG: YabP/YqfC family sporulation protein [Oscillospiraceae bacterium]|nr:YabP/YqfC family sporulation protein [Bacillota bacterium]MBQ4565465.1 YabP/YqfC family sporulation protein [Oscillospiraceae bacterium]
MKKGIKSSITQVLEIPGEVLTDASVMSIVGKNEIDIENYKSILEYGRDRITINTAGCMIFIEGSALELNYVTADSVNIKGNIASVAFKEL